MSQSITAVILAAGKGTRMKSSRAKVLHEVFFQPMVHHVLDAVNKTAVNKSVLIVGHQKEKVLEATKKYTLTPVVQEEQLGTGHAVLVAEKECEGADLVLILCGDTPLIKSESLEAMIAQHLGNHADITLMTTRLDNPFGYGRIIKDGEGNINRIVEQKDASPEEQQVQDINVGIYLVERQFLFDTLKQVGTDNSQGEVYLTDIIALGVDNCKLVQNFLHPVPIDVLGVNSRVELAQAQQVLQQRRNEDLMMAGNTLLSPESIVIAPSVSLGGDCLIDAGVHITGKSAIGKRSSIATGAVIDDCQIGDGARIGAHAVLEHCHVKKNEQVAPLTHRTA